MATALAVKPVVVFVLPAAYLDYQKFCILRGIRPMDLEAWQEAEFKLFTECCYY